MALAAQQALLDELMGKNRNACDGENPPGPHWSDDDQCKCFLCGFCPHELFVNTKTDLGPCTRVHDERMRDSYKRSKRNAKMGYEAEFVRYLNRLVEDVDKRIRRGHERLSVNKNVNNPDPEIPSEKITNLTKRINDLIKQAEALGTEGKVDQAQGVLKLCEQLKFERSQLEGDTRTGMSQELEVCEICGAFRIKDDAPQRVEEHLTGKMHLGYAKIRDYLRQYSEQRTNDVGRSENLRDSRSGHDRSSPRYHRDLHHHHVSARDHRRHDDGNHNRREAVDRHRSSRDYDRRPGRDGGGGIANRNGRSRSRSKRPDNSSSSSSSRRHSTTTSKSSNSRRDTSPFSAARRPPEGAEDY